MASGETLGASFAIDVSNLKAGLATANRLIRESESEFKAAAAGMDDWANSEEGLNAQIKNLNNITDLQQKKVDALTANYDDLIRNGLDPASSTAVTLRTQINNETAALNKNKSALSNAESALAELGDAADEAADDTEAAGDAADDAGESFEGLKTAAQVGATAIAAVAAAAAAAITSFFALGESTREAREDMAKLTSAFDGAKLSSESADKTFTTLFGVMGESDTAVEAAQHIARLASSEEEAAKWAEQAANVTAVFGDALKPEAFYESANEVLKLGESTGTWTQMLENTGIVSVDEFNTHLASLNTEQEKQAYMLEISEKAMGAAGGAYRETASDIIAAKEAEAEMQLALQELGAIAEPIMTTLKVLAADLLTAITPFVSLIGEGLSGALEGADGAAEKLSEGISGILQTLLEKARSMLPVAIDLISALVPDIISTVLAALPQLLQTVIDIGYQLIITISEILSSILAKIGELLPQIIIMIINAIPQLLEAATTLFLSIIQAISYILPQLIVALPGIIDAIISAIITAIPLLLDAAIKLFDIILSDALPALIDALIVAAPQIVTSVIDGILTALPLLLDAAIRLFMVIVEKALPLVVNLLLIQAPKLVYSIITAIIGTIPKLLKTAVDLFMKFPEAWLDMAKGFPKFIKNFISDLVSNLKKGVGDMKDMGANMIKGLWEGISDMGGWIASKIKGFGENVLGTLKSFFGINSPSKVMADQVGKNLALGVGVGFENAIADVNKTLTGAVQLGGVSLNANGAGAGGSSVVVNQYNTYSAAHSRYELYKSRQDTSAAVKLALLGVG